MFDLNESVSNVSTIKMKLMSIYLTIFILSHSFILSTMTSLVYDLTMYYIVSYLLSRKY